MFLDYDYSKNYPSSDYDYLLGAVPAAELEIDDLHCATCSRQFLDDDLVYHEGGGRHHCESCLLELIATWRIEAAAYALEHCEITVPLPRYDEDLEYRCTPEEYKSGARESYSPNAYLACCRHEYTNYNRLIKCLERYSVKHNVYYSAIYDRIMDLVLAAVEAMPDEDED